VAGRGGFCVRTRHGVVQGDPGHAAGTFHGLRSISTGETITVACQAQLGSSSWEAGHRKGFSGFVS
jgi:hypothetical protein